MASTKAWIVLFSGSVRERRGQTDAGHPASIAGSGPADAATRSIGGAYRRRDPYYLNLISFRNLASFCADYNLRLINPALQLFCFCLIKDLNRSFTPE
jgi:hypothetical protein